jgi:hypothetical protein
MEIISSLLTEFRGQVAKLWIQKRQRPRIRKPVTSPTLLQEPQISHDSFDSLTAQPTDKNPNWHKQENCLKGSNKLCVPLWLPPGQVQGKGS